LPALKNGFEQVATREWSNLAQRVRPGQPFAGVAPESTTIHRSQQAGAFEAGANKEDHMVEQTQMLLTYIRARLGRDEGQALVEYALIISLIALIAIGGLTLAGKQIGSMFSKIPGGLTP
jgi:Flp pilus assembly pilin Flp